MAKKTSRRAPKKAPRAPRKPEDFGEACLHKHCQAWLESSGIWGRYLIFHVPNERRGGIGTVMHFKRMGVRPGVADYLLFANGRAAAVELKDKKGEQRKDQEKFQRQWEALGYPYFIARTLEEFQGIMIALTLF